MARLSLEAAVFVTFVACAGEAPAPGTPADGAPAYFSQGREPIVSGWELTPERLAPSACAACHPTEHEEWRGGAHARSWRNRRFQRAYELEPRAWCRHCHAPLALQEANPTARDAGISCVACHVRNGRMIAAQSADASPHRTLVDPDFGGPAFCAGCHQFAFPVSLGDPIVYSEQPMQNTFAEWQESGAPPCADCHRRGHRLLGPSDPGWLRSLVRGAAVDRRDEDVLSFRIELAARGHRAPTGDLFRSLELEIARDEAFEEMLLRRRYGRVLGPGFVTPFVVSSRVDVLDTTIPAADRFLRVTIDRPALDVVYARLRYHYHDPTGTDLGRAEPDDSLVLWSRAVSLEPEPSLEEPADEP